MVCPSIPQTNNRTLPNCSAALRGSSLLSQSLSFFLSSVPATALTPAAATSTVVPTTVAPTLTVVATTVTAASATVNSMQPERSRVTAAGRISLNTGLWCSGNVAGAIALVLVLVLVPMRRIELPTSPLPRECSTTEPHGHSGLVPEIGVEPTTFALRMRCSTN